MPWALLASTFVVATCGLVYELLAGTLASYLLGDSVTQFSTVIGAYLFSMGIGSFLSRYVREPLARRFVEVETLVGPTSPRSGSCSTPWSASSGSWWGSRSPS
jgi:spermidine synthase